MGSRAILFPLVTASARLRRRIGPHMSAVLWDSIAWRERRTAWLLRFECTLPVYTQLNGIVDQHTEKARSGHLKGMPHFCGISRTISHG